MIWTCLCISVIGIHDLLNQSLEVFEAYPSVVSAVCGCSCMMMYLCIFKLTNSSCAGMYIICVRAALPKTLQTHVTESFDVLVYSKMDCAAVALHL